EVEAGRVLDAAYRDAVLLPAVPGRDRAVVVRHRDRDHARRAGDVGGAKADPIEHDDDLPGLRRDGDAGADRLAAAVDAAGDDEQLLARGRERALVGLELLPRAAVVAVRLRHHVREVEGLRVGGRALRPIGGRAHGAAVVAAAAVVGQLRLRHRRG